MNPETSYSSSTLDHLGLVAGMVDDTLGRALDAVSAYGPEALYGQNQVVLQLITEH